MNTALPSDLALWNADLLAQWAALARQFLVPGRPRFGLQVGPHLRHVLEHHEALLWPAAPGRVRYDDRPRDARVEAEPGFALQRLARVDALLRQPAALPAAHAALQVELRIGLAGDRVALVDSSFGRELAVVGHHAVHHMALVVDHCHAYAIPLPDGAGRAPATVAHARATLQTVQEMQ